MGGVTLGLQRAALNDVIDQQQSGGDNIKLYSRAECVSRISHVN